AEALVNCVPASCMPSPESPAKRIVTASRSSSAALRCGGSTSADGLETVIISSKSGGRSQESRDQYDVADPGPLTPDSWNSGPLPLLLNRVGRGGQVVNCPGKVSDQVVDDPLDGKDAHRPPRLIDNRQVPVASFLHAPDRHANRVLGVNGNRV